jgi:tetratricopeptide (TPR) repeat protein
VTLPTPVARALEAALATPGDVTGWERLEATAAEHACPDAVADAYRKVLQEALPVASIALLGERAARFHQEWLSDRPELLVEILERVVAADPSADWAQKRLIVALTLSESWDRLLGVYDRALALVPERGRRVQLLEEAVQVAKDFVGDADRAIGYLQMLAALKPGDWQVTGALERLLERQGRWAELVASWRARIETTAGDEARALRVRVATVQIERLGSPAQALEEARTLLADEAGRDGLALGERLIALESAPMVVRLEALRLVEARHDRDDRPELALAAVRAALAFATGADRAELHRDAAERLAAGGAGREAAEHLAALLEICPDDGEVQDRLRRQCAAIGEAEPYARGLAAAAARTGNARRQVALWLEAGEAHERLLRDDAGAIGFYERVRAAAAAEPAERLRALRRLDDRLEAQDRRPERAAVLEELVALASRRIERRPALGALARLWAGLGEIDRAVAAWEQCLEAEPADREAIDGLVAVLAAGERWQPLVAALRRRMAAPVEEHQRRADLEQIARLHAGPIGDRAGAIESWREHARSFGPSGSGAEALAELLAAAKRWEELGSLLTETAIRDRAGAAALGARLGDLCRNHLDAPAQAATWYRRALEADATQPDARAGLMTLVGAPAPAEARVAACAALAVAAAETDDWKLTLALVEPRLAVADGPAAKAALLREAAALAEKRADDRAAALAAVTRAMPLAPDDRTLEREALRLAGETGDYAALGPALAGAIAALAAGSRRRVELLALRGDVCESRLGDSMSALDAYREALDAEPGRLDLRRLVVRVAGRVGRWDDVARALVASELAGEVRTRDLLPLAEAAAQETSGFAGLAAAVVTAVGSAELPAEAVAELEARVAVWYGEKLGEVGASEAALVRALAAAPEDVATLRQLVELRRRSPSPALHEALLRLAELAPGDLDPLAEATELARGLPLDPGRTLTTAGRLLDEAARLLRKGARAGGARPADEAARLAVETLAAGLLATGAPVDARRAITLELEAAALPLGAEATRAMRRAAAAIAEERLGDRPLAIDIRRVLVGEAPDDAEAADALAALYAAEDRLLDLAELRRRQLERSGDAERRLALRLEIERISAVLEQRSDRLTLLRANLSERPGHAVTVDTVAELLGAKHRHAELADLYEEQATRVENLGDADTAARLWTRMARLAEDALADRPRAIRGHDRAVALVATAPSLDALGRLCLEQGDAEAAARWLDRRLTMAEAGEAPAVAMRLARAYLACDRRHRAIACLERVLEAEPAAGEVRALLAELYRAARTWEPLAALLGDGTAFLTTRDELVASAREAHRLYRDEVGDAGRAAPALERASAAAPDDADLAMALATSLASAGRLDDARARLERLLPVTRRSSERAAIHRELGRVARGQGDLPAALAALEQASAIDMGNPEILSLLGDTARKAGELERAERAYRGLLMVLRRREPSSSPAVITVAETLMALYELAAERGEADKAAELLDSAFEAATVDPNSLARVRERLAQRGELGVLATALERRAAAGKSPEAQAEAYREIADVRAQLGDDAGAFEAVLAALQVMPDASALHDRARQVARAAGLLDRYLDAIETIVDRRRRRDDGPLVARLLLAAGEIAERDLADPPRALGFYRRAGEIGDLPAEAASALARVGATCDPAERAKALARLGRLAREAASPAEQADALYRLAESELAMGETREAGLETLSAALEKHPTMDRALAIVRDAAVPNEELHRVLPLYERLARASGDDRMLLDCLERRAASPDASVDPAREGYDLALSLHEDARGEALLERVVAIGRAPLGPSADAIWGLLELARRRRDKGNFAGAHRALADALAIGDAAVILPQLRELARQALAVGAGGDAAASATAADIYETLRSRAPEDPSLWRTLIDLYVRAGDGERLERLVAGTLDQLADPRARNEVRMRFAAFRLERDPDDRAAVDLLRDVVLDEPDHEEANARLADLYERHGEDAMLVEILDRRRRSLADRGDLEGVARTALKLAALTSRDRPDEAVEVLRWGLERLPGEPALVEALLNLIAGDAGDHRLRAVEAVLAQQPRQDEVRAAREARYRAAEMWEPLAHLLVESAEHEKAPPKAAARLREAAGIHRTHLFDFPIAAELLRKARALDPQDVELVRDLTRLLVELGEPQKALAETLVACRTPDLPAPVRSRLLRFRAEMLVEHGKRDAAIPVLLEALAGATGDAKKEIQATIERLRAEGGGKPAAARPEPPAPPPTPPSTPPAAKGEEDLLEITLIADTTQH